MEEKQEEIVKALDSILNKIREAEKKEANLSKLFHAFLGKKNVFGALKNEIEDLKAADYANLPEAKLRVKSIVSMKLMHKFKKKLAK